MPHSVLSQDLETDRAEWIATLDTLTPGELQIPYTPEDWHIPDFVGHLAHWEQVTLAHIGETLKDGRPTLESSVETVANSNERAAEPRRSWFWDRIRAEFENTRNALIERVKGLTDGQLAFQIPSPWANDARIYPLETLIREDVLDHSREHHDDVKAWLQKSRTDAAVAKP